MSGNPDTCRMNTAVRITSGLAVLFMTMFCFRVVAETFITPNVVPSVTVKRCQMTPKELRDRLSKILGTAKLPKAELVENQFIIAAVNNLVVLLGEIDALENEVRLLKSENDFMRTRFQRLANFEGTESPVLFAQTTLDDLDILRGAK